MFTVLKPYLATDVYKVGHCQMYPEQMEYLFSNFTPRSNSYYKGSSLYDGKSVMVGLQGLLKWLDQLWNDEFFERPLEQSLKNYRRVVGKILNLDEDKVYVKHLEKLHNIGYLPLRIYALPEGTVVDVKVPVMTIHNTVAGFGWLVNYLETVLSAGLWNACVGATIARDYRTVLTKAAVDTGAPLWFVDYQGHDFSYRGQTPQDVVYKSFGHLTSFVGTDTIPAVLFADAYYGSKNQIGSSVMASEHSVACANIAMWQKLLECDLYEAEKAFLKDYITRIVPTGIASYVSDTFDFYGVIDRIAVELKDVIMNRDGKVVFRPDSGCPVKILTGYHTYSTGLDKELAYHNFVGVHGNIFDPDLIVSLLDGEYEAIALNHNGVVEYFELVYSGQEDGDYTISIGRQLPECEARGAVETLYKHFGGTVNEKGYVTLDQHVGLIYGDSITIERAEKIMARLMAKGFASDNVVFGIGSFTYQYNTRDTFGYAMKATAMKMVGEPEYTPLQKDPKTGDGMKKSARGLLDVYRSTEDGELFMVDNLTKEQWESGYIGEDVSAMELVYDDGFFVNQSTLDEIRERIISSIKI